MKKILFFILALSLLTQCGIYRKTDARKVPGNVNDRVQKNSKVTNESPKKPVRKQVAKKPTKPRSGNVKPTPTPAPKPIDDNIGNRIEPTKKKTVRRAKNDPRAGS